MKNGLMCLTNSIDKKCGFEFYFYFFIFTFLHSYFKLISCTSTVILHKIWDHIFKTVFLEFFFCVFFICKAQKCSERCANCVWNCMMPLFTSFPVQFSKNLFFKNVLLLHPKYKQLFWRWYLKDIEEKNHGIEKSRA